MYIYPILSTRPKAMKNIADTDLLRLKQVLSCRPSPGDRPRRGTAALPPVNGVLSTGRGLVTTIS